MRYVTVKEMRELDRMAIEGRGIPAATLMDRAGKAVADEAMHLVRGGPVMVICGYGNNGGDGFVAARYLVQARYTVRLFLVGNPRSFSPETDEHMRALAALGVTPELITEREDVEGACDEWAASILIIDALCGVGIRGPVDELFRTVIEAMNAADRTIISIDVPSGLDADNGRPLPVAVKATETVTMGYPKAGFGKPAAKPYVGELVIADIGI